MFMAVKSTAELKISSLSLYKYWVCLEVLDVEVLDVSVLLQSVPLGEGCLGGQVNKEVGS